MLRLPWLLLLPTTAVLLLLLDKWDIAAYPSGDSICVSVVAYLHLTTPASEVHLAGTAVPAQSCINPAACRSRVFTELSLRCTTMVRPRDDYSMTATATVRLASATATRATTKLLRWQMLLAFTTDGRMKRLEHLLRPRSGHSSQDGSGETSTAVESWLAVVPMHVRALRIRGVLITTAVVAGCK
jgi:hypothetical protein